MSILINSICCTWVIFSMAAGLAAAAPCTLAQQVLAETNLARTKPLSYAGYLREFRRQFQGKSYKLPGSGATVMTSEGVAALDEAVNFLSKQAPLPPLAWSQGLDEAAAELASDEGKTGQIGHTGSRSGNMRQRIERHGNWTGRIAENIGYGPDTARMMVMELIIDDGVAGRGHRNNIFHRDLAVAGVACGPHPVYRVMCVMDFASGFQNSGRR
jgi:uncharacterized protein YkwD